MKDTILYIDDKEENLDVFSVNFEDDFNIITTTSAKEGFLVLEKYPVKVVISDQRMPEENGLEFISRAHKKFPDIMYIILTAYADIEVITDAINQGYVHQFITKPWQEDELKITIENALEQYNLRQHNKQLIKDLEIRNNELNILKNKLEEQNFYLKEEIKLEHNFENIICKDKKFKKILQNLEQVAVTEATVLILGETGTGKELIARAIHNISQRNKNPIIKVDCASIPPTLIESELFGHEKGAFTSAFKQKKGKFEYADGGSIFLDEIGELPVELQPKLLRVLQDGEIERIGGDKVIKVNVRVIAATNRNLIKEIEKGSFRNDLYYRLNVFPLNIPALRDRKEDIPILVNHFLDKFNKKNGKNIKKIHIQALEKLKKYNWPGNIRELENIIERAVILSNGNKLEIEKCIPAINISKELSEFTTMVEYEKQYLIKVLEHTYWRIGGENGAAKILDMKPTTLQSRMKKLGIKRPI